MKYGFNFLGLSWGDKISNSLFDFNKTSSISGNHVKIEMVEKDDCLENALYGDIIVKSHESQYKINKKINANEHFFTYLAAQCGIETTRQLICSAEDDYLLLSERFDKNHKIIHLSDFLKLENYFDFKLIDFTQKIDGVDNSFEIKEALSKQIFFNLVIGNLDSHANNFSLLEDKNGLLSVSPMYDICHTDGLLKQFNIINTKNIITISGKNKNISVDDIMNDLNVTENEKSILTKNFKDIALGINEHLKDIAGSFIDKQQQNFIVENINTRLFVYLKELGLPELQKEDEICIPTEIEQMSDRERENAVETLAKDIDKDIISLLV